MKKKDNDKKMNTELLEMLNEQSPTNRTMILLEMPWGRDKDPRIPLGHASLLASLKKFGSGEVVSIVSPINDSRTTPEYLLEMILDIINHRCEVDIAIGAYVWCEDVLTKLLTLLRTSGFPGRIILGGPQISYTPSGLEELYPEADVFVRGYGEMAIVGLFNEPNIEQIQGVHFAGGKDLNEQTIVDLSMLPSPWLTESIDLDNQKFIRWESQRGCPFTCGFCQHKEAGMRLKRQELDQGRVLSEIDLFCRSEVEEIAVLDPIFNSNRSVAKLILQRFIDNNFTGKLALQCRAEMCDEEFLIMCSQLNVKLEFGLQTIHKVEYDAVNRPNNMRKVNEVFDKLTPLNIDIEVSIIFGLPNQTLTSFQETVDWCLSKQIPVIKAFPLMLLRGTEVEQRRVEWGLLESSGTMPVVEKSDTFSHEEWLEMCRLSEALKITEGNHPATVDELSEITSELGVRMERFHPIQPTIETGWMKFSRSVRGFTFWKLFGKNPA